MTRPDTEKRDNERSETAFTALEVLCITADRELTERGYIPDCEGDRQEPWKIIHRHVKKHFDLINQNAPQWRDRPTCAGWWMAAIYQVDQWPDIPTKFETWNVGENFLKFCSQSAPAFFEQEGWKQRWFGPIPEPPKEQK